MKRTILNAFATCIAVTCLAACGGGGGSGSDTTGTANDRDVTPPAVTGWAPASTDVAVNASITAAFTEPIDNASITVQEKDNPSVSVDGSVQHIADTAIFTPTTDLKPETDYTVNVTATDQAGNSQDASWNFRTGTASDTTPPEVLLGSETPADGATAVPANASISVTFNEPIFPFLFGAIDGVPTAVSFDYTSNRVTITPTQNLRPGTYNTYILARDLAGNPMAAPFRWSFTVAAAP